MPVGSTIRGILSKYAGRPETLYFGVYGSGRSKYYDAQFVDDVSLIGTTIPGLGPGGSWGPANVVDGFMFPRARSATGQGQTAAIAIDSTVAPSDLKSYLKYFGIARTGAVTNEAVDGGSRQTGEAEANLDVETIAGLAPAANIMIYVMPVLSNQAIEDAYNQVVSDGKATVVNSSFGECETTDETFSAFTDDVALGAAAQGITFSASSGDSGAVSCGLYASVNSPASDPHFVSVGGTQSGSWNGATSAITSPRVWNTPVDNDAGGGGVSVVWTPPPYQQGLAGARQSGRSVPDIALPSVNDGLFLNNEWYREGGTSWSSPIYVAMQLAINQNCVRTVWGIKRAL